MPRRSSTVCFFVAIAALHAQGLTPRATPAEYPVHAELKADPKGETKEGFTLAAEYLVHTLPTSTLTGNTEALVANDYLVVEAAVFGPRGKRIDLSQGSFTLILDTGKKGGRTVLTPDSAGTVAGSIKFSDWTPKPHMEGSAGVGNATVGVGPPMTARFPGDPSVRPLPPSPVPEQNAAGIEKEQPLSIDERVQRASLPGGELSPPAAGLIFFPYDGKTKSIKTLELIYEGPAGRVVLKLE
jgi:hypothetical protein